MGMCAALARLGHQVDLVTKRGSGRPKPIEDIFAFYGLEPNFRLIELARPAFRGGGLVFSALVRRLVKGRGKAYDLALCRDLLGAYFAAGTHMPVAFEAHGTIEAKTHLGIWERVLRSQSFRGLITISNALAEDFRRRRLTRPDGQILVAPDGAEASLVTRIEQHERAQDHRERPFSIGYVGNLYPGRGVGLMRRLAENLTDCSFHLVGGDEHSISSLRALVPPNVVVHGFVAPADLAGLYARFDVLLMPYQKRVGVASGAADTVRWMSPMKMFEYMASGKAIISSDLPVLREVLVDGRNARLVPPGDLESWLAAIRELREDAPLRRALGERAKAELLDKYTWDARARNVLDFLESS